MPIVHVHIWEGLGEEVAASLINGIGQVFIDLGTPPENLQILIHETPKTHWGKGRKPASESTPDR
jgi:4-oxalocrotonate tautomerase